MSNVIQFPANRAKLSVKNGKVVGSPHLKTPEPSEDFGDRMQRIRASLEKINQLMADLKANSKKLDDEGKA